MFSKYLIYTLSFLVKGWEVSILLILPFIQKETGINLFLVGLLGMTLSIFQISSNLLSGIFSEKLGSKFVIFFSIFSYSLAWYIVGFTKELALLFIVYALAGVGSGLFMPLANSYIAKIAREKMGQEFGNFSAITDLGRIILSSYSVIVIGFLGLTFLPLTFGVLATILALIFLFTNIQVGLEKSKVNIAKINVFSFLKNKKYLFAQITGMIDAFSSASLYIFIPFLLIAKGIDTTQAGFITTIFFAGYLAGRLILGRLSDKHGETKILVIAEILMAFTIFLLVLAEGVYLIGVTIFLLGVFTRGTSPITRGMVAKSLTHHEGMDKAFGLYSFSVNSTSTVSRPLYGFIANSFGITSVFITAGLVVFSAIYPIIMYGKVKSEQE